MGGSPSSPVLVETTIIVTRPVRHLHGLDRWAILSRSSPCRAARDTSSSLSPLRAGRPCRRTAATAHAVAGTRSLTVGGHARPVVIVRTISAARMTSGPAAGCRPTIFVARFPRTGPVSSIWRSTSRTIDDASSNRVGIGGPPIVHDHHHVGHTPPRSDQRVQRHVSVDACGRRRSRPTPRAGIIQEQPVEPSCSVDTARATSTLKQSSTVSRPSARRRVGLHRGLEDRRRPSAGPPVLTARNASGSSSSPDRRDLEPGRFAHRLHDLAAVRPSAARPVATPTMPRTPLRLASSTMPLIASIARAWASARSTASLPLAEARDLGA